jgi:hypothetical protein
MRDHIRHVLWFSLALLVAACSREPEAAATSNTPAPASAATTAPAAADPAAGSVAAVALGPGTLPLTIRFILPAPPVVGQPATLNLFVMSDQSLKRVEISSSSAALDIDPAAGALAIDSVEPGVSQALELGFTPRAAGLADVEFEVRVMTEDGQLQSRYAIPVLSVAPAAGG